MNKYSQIRAAMNKRLHQILVWSSINNMWIIESVSIPGIAIMRNEGYIFRVDILDNKETPTLEEMREALEVTLKYPRPSSMWLGLNRLEWLR